MPHAWQILPYLPEARRALHSVGDFIARHTRD